MDRLYGGTVNMFGFRTKETGEDWRAELQKEIESMNEKYGLRLNPVVIAAEADIARLDRPVPLRAKTRGPPLPLFLPTSPEQQGDSSENEGDGARIMESDSEGGKATGKGVGRRAVFGDITNKRGSPDRTLVENTGLPSLSTAQGRMSAPTSDTMVDAQDAVWQNSGGALSTKAVRTTSMTAQKGDQTDKEVPKWTRPRQTARKTGKRKAGDENLEQSGAKKARPSNTTSKTLIVAPAESAVVSGAGGRTTTRTHDAKGSNALDVENEGAAVGKKVSSKSELRSKVLAELAKKKRERSTGTGSSWNAAAVDVPVDEVDPRHVQSHLINSCQTAAAAIAYTYKTTSTVDFPQTCVFLKAFDKLNKVNLAHRRSGKSQREVTQLMATLHNLSKINLRSINGQDGGQLTDVKGKAKRLVDKYEKDQLDAVLEVHDSTVLSCH